MSLRKFVRRLGRRVKQIAPLATLALPFAGPAAAALGAAGKAAKVAGVLTKVSKVSSAVSAATAVAAARSPVQTEALPMPMRQAGANGSRGAMSILPTVATIGRGAVLPALGEIAGNVIAERLTRRGTRPAMPANVRRGFVTGGTMPASTRGMTNAQRQALGLPPKRRRMNPYNPRAARRAIRRIKALRREMQKIERMLPKQRSSSRVRHVPSGYRHTRR